MKHVGIVFKNTENADAMDYLKKSLENIFEEYVQFTRLFDSYISKRSLKALKQLYFFVKKFVLFYSIF